MQQLSRTCIVTNHKQKVIEYVCTYSQCQLSRFLCSKCALESSHKHNQSDISHILDNIDFYEKIKNNLHQAKGNEQQKNYDIEKSVVPLKQLMQQFQNLLKNIQNIIQQIEEGKLQNININHLENQLLNIQKNGFNQIDDQSLDILINMPEQQKDLEIYQQLEAQANLIIQNALKIKEWRFQQVENKQSLSYLQKIKNAKYQIQQIDDTGDKEIKTGTISNDLEYIVSGGSDQLLKIWDYQTNKLIKQIELNHFVTSCQFTEDSKLLYAGSNQYVYQFDVQNQFKELYRQKIHNSFINCIYCITNTTILTSSYDKTIIKTDVDKKQQLLKIQAHNNYIIGLDYNKSLDIIASGSVDKSVKLWNGNDGSLIIEKLNAHNDKKYIRQDSGEYISLVLEQQYIIATGRKFIKVYSIKGEFVRQFDHEVDQFWVFNTVQLDSMKVVLIKGKFKLQVCQIDMD